MDFLSFLIETSTSQFVGRTRQQNDVLSSIALRSIDTEPLVTTLGKHSGNALKN